MSKPSPIAIVGVGGLFPQAPDPGALWSNVARKGCAAKDVPRGRWLIPRELAFDPAKGAPDKVYSTKGCFVEGFSLDPAGLALDPELLRELDPVFHFALHAGRQAFRDAATAGLDLRRVGIAIGNIALPTERFSALCRRYLLETFKIRAASQEVHPINRYAAGLPASLLAKALGLGGGSFTLDAACASSLYALKLASDALSCGRVDAMLAGGVSRPDCLYTQMGFSQLRALSARGIPAPLDEAADGIVVGEGAGLFLLKRLDDALRHGDRVYAVVRGIGLSNDIGGSLLAPDGGGQLRAMRAAYAEAGWRPQDVDLIECHAAGTPVGDGVELRSLKALWGSAGWKPGQCSIGSVKSNVGHMLTAAGAAGLVKVLLAMREGTLPPSANFSKAAPGADLGTGPLRVQTEPEEWRPRRGARRAAVSAFGFGGINAHVLLEKFDPGAGRPKGRAASVEKTQAAAPSGIGPGGPTDGAAGSGIEPAAIIGMEARFGALGSLREFQEAVLSGTGGAAGRMPDLAVPAQAYRIPPKELEEMLPQQVLMLQAADAALRDADFLNRDHERAGVFIGMELDCGTADYHFRWSLPEPLRDSAGPALSANRTMGALGGIIASRIAREFRVGGPSFTLAGDETSGLRALEAALLALERRELDCAVVGAVDMAADPRSARAYAALHGPSAQGAGLSDGAAAVVLKRLGDALKDGDRVYAVIRGLGVASGPGACKAALERAWSESGLDPASAGLLELGGAAPGDERAEAAAACVFGKRDGISCAVGSVEPVIGRAGAALGLASLVKTALALYQQVLPGNPSAELAGGLGPDSARLHAPRRAQFWLRNRVDGPRRAGVSSLGLGGNGVHVVLEELDPVPFRSVRPVERLQPLGARPEGLFVLEADNPPGLAASARRLRDWARRPPRERAIEALARDWWSHAPAEGKKALGLAFVSRDATELLAQAETAERSLLRDPSSRIEGMDRIFYSPEPVGRKGRVAFVFPGSGNQYLGMGLGAGVHWPEILRAQDEENKRLKDQFVPELFAPWRLDWPEGWEAGALERLASDHKAMIFGQVAHGAAMSDLVRSFGVEPSAVIGYSLGETAGLFALRAWRDRDEMLRRMQSSDLFVSELAGPCNAARRSWGLAAHEAVDWALGVVDRPEKLVRAAVSKLEKVFVLIVNTPKECVVGGAGRAVKTMVKELGGTFLPLDGVTTVHCSVAKEVEAAYRELHLLPTTAPEGARFYSGAWARSYEPTRESAAESITAQAVGGIDFPAVVQRAYEDGARIFLEMGPRNTCSRMVSKILGEKPHLARSACVRDQDDVSTVLRLLGALAAERAPFGLGRLYGGQSLAVGHRPFEEPARSGLVRIPMGPPASKASLGPAPSASPAPRPASTPPEPVLAVPAAGVFSGFAAVEEAKAAAHAQFLLLSQASAAAQSRVLSLQAALLGAGSTPPPAVPMVGSREPAPAAPPVVGPCGPTGGAAGSGTVPAAPPVVGPDGPTGGTAGSGTVPAAPPVVGPGEPAIFMTREQCLEFAVGKIGNVLGEAFAAADGHPTRVRLPAEPLMLVDRILSVEGEPRSLASGRVVTEHDVLPGAWYLDGGRVPTCVAVEAGQADLFLAGYLGIDFKTKGKAMYRLLDAAVTFHRGLPGPGEVIRYDIRIDRFARQGSTYLFFFSFESTAGGKPLLSMREGCAGFFTAEELQAGKGIVFTELDRRPVPGKRPADWKELAAMAEEAYDDRAVEALRSGDLAAAFGPAFAGLGLKDPARLPGAGGARMRLIDRVLSLEPAGGRYGLGLLRAEADIHPEDWFLTCHFSDDMVMPGTLMYECCMHALRIFLMRLGWVGEREGAWCEPVPGVSSRLKCRGQVLPSTKKVIYEISIKELGYGPAPYAVADALMYSDGRPIVLITDMSIRLGGLSREKVEALWERKKSPAPAKPALYGPQSILAFSNGRPSEAFGEPYKIFDKERVIARLPGPPYQFLDRITDVRGGKPFVLEAGCQAQAEYDVPPDAWYFASNGQGSMPFAVLLEVALQPCGWLAAYLGSALTSSIDLSFRNLGGKAMLLEEVLPDAGTLTTTVKITRVSQSAGMIIQNFDMRVANRGRLVYKGDTYFGFFSKQALSDQKGILGVETFGDRIRGRPLIISGEPPLALPDKTLRMIDAIDLFAPEGGPKGLGFIRGVKAVDPAEWFFKAHFHQDPVCPGSLGLESFQQLLKAYARRRWRETAGPAARFTPMALGEPHEWVYRGQVIPGNKRVIVEAAVTSVDDESLRLTADGFLWVDGLLIYRMKGFSLSVR